MIMLLTATHNDRPARLHSRRSSTSDAVVRPRHAGAVALVLRAAALALLAPLSGCFTSGFYEHRPQAAYPDTAVLPSAPFPPRALPMFAGNTGRLLTWTDFMQGVFWADVVFLGEMHDDKVGHEVQRAIFVDTLLLDQRTALSMEMLERQDQAALDEYLAGAIDAPTFIARTDSANWGGKDKFVDYYLPIIDEAKARGTRVIAANAPREYVRMARLEGWSALRALPPERQELFSLPRPLADGRYELRFRDLMIESAAEHGASIAPTAPPPDAPAPEGAPAGAAPTDATPAPAPTTGPSPEMIAAAFRAQLLWDSTMGDSIARALGPPWSSTAPNRIVHLVGAFHVDFNGGTPQQTRARSSFARFLTVSLVHERATALREEDVGRADVVIYTGWSGREDGLQTGER